MYAKHNTLGLKVVIKSVPSEQYNARAAIFAISEVDAQRLCQKSEFVLEIVDSFEFDESVHIVTRF